MNYQKEKDFQTKATNETFDEIYTKYDISVEEVFDASQGYPFDYPLRWLNDPSMNKRIAVRRLSCIPTSHCFTIKLVYYNSERDQFSKTVSVDITHEDSLIKVLAYLCRELSEENSEGETRGLAYDYDEKNNQLLLYFVNYDGMSMPFRIEPHLPGIINDLEELLKFLNQPITEKGIDLLRYDSADKNFFEVWNRDIVQFHASFSTSKRKFIGISGDFYTIPTVLYPAPTNESTFYVRFTNDGKKNILIRHSVFMIQLCYFVNYQKAKIL